MVETSGSCHVSLWSSTCHAVHWRCSFAGPRQHCAVVRAGVRGRHGGVERNIQASLWVWVLLLW